MEGSRQHYSVIETTAIYPTDAENLPQWSPQVLAEQTLPAWLLFHSTFQRFLSNPIPKLPQGEVAPYAVNHMLPIALLHCQEELKTAEHKSQRPFRFESHSNGRILKRNTN